MAKQIIHVTYAPEAVSKPLEHEFSLWAKPRGITPNIRGASVTDWSAMLSLELECTDPTQLPHAHRWWAQRGAKVELGEYCD